MLSNKVMLKSLTWSAYGMFHKGVVENLILSMGEQHWYSSLFLKRLLVVSSSSFLFRKGSGAGFATYQKKKYSYWQNNIMFALEKKL